MSAFNIIPHPLACPSCGEQMTVEVQFKYGIKAQTVYSMGDPIRFPQDQPSKPDAWVVADGVTDGVCPSCGVEYEQDMYIFVHNGVISSVERADGRYPLPRTDVHFILLPA
jgi:rubredoxin